MQSHFLKLNKDKSELLVITKPSLSQCGVTSLNICGTIMNASQSVRNLGVYYDSVLKMDTHIMTICKKAYYQIHLIHKVRKYISEDAAKMLVQANVTPLLDYCNGLLIGLPDILLNRLQRVQNCAARIIKCAPKFCHIMPILKDLHWLPVKYRIQYKIVLMTFKALNGLAPPYIDELIEKYEPTRNLRSANENLLTPKSFSSVNYGERCFEGIAPSLWNGLTTELRKPYSIDCFKSKLKTHYFNIAFK